MLKWKKKRKPSYKKGEDKYIHAYTIVFLFWKECIIHVTQSLKKPQNLKRMYYWVKLTSFPCERTSQRTLQN